MTISPNEDDVLTALRAFALDRLPEGVDVVLGVENRVAEPTEPNFAVITTIRSARLSTNVDEVLDVKVTGSIAPIAATFTGSIVPAPRAQGVMPFGILTVTVVVSGSIVEGAVLTGGGVLASTFVGEQIDGTPGGAGSYAVSRSQEILSGTLGLSGGLMTVTAVAAGSGAIEAGANVYGIGVTTPTIVRTIASGSGGIGTYVVAPSQTFGPGTLSAGRKTIRQNSTFTVQMDFHGETAAAAHDMAQTISTAFRDEYATTFFSALTGGLINPLFADDPRFTPFQNENQQYERRWVLEANLQVNQTITVPQQFADSAVVEIEDIQPAA